MGGKEFLLFNYNTQASIKIADEIRFEIQKLPGKPLIPTLVLTASFDVASLKPQETQEDWLKRCDQKLYIAKEKGRNQVIA